MRRPIRKSRGSAGERSLLVGEADTAAPPASRRRRAIRCASCTALAIRGAVKERKVFANPEERAAEARSHQRHTTCVTKDGRILRIVLGSLLLDQHGISEAFERFKLIVREGVQVRGDGLVQMLDRRLRIASH